MKCSLHVVAVLYFQDVEHAWGVDVAFVAIVTHSFMLA